MGGADHCRPRPLDPLPEPPTHEVRVRDPDPLTDTYVHRKKGVHSGSGMVKTIQVSASELLSVPTRRIVECELSFVAAAQMLSGISRPRPRRTKPVFYIEGQQRT